MSLPPSCSVREAPAVLVIVPTVDVIDGIGHSRRSLCLFFCLSSRRNLLLSLLLFLPLPVLSAPTPNKRHLDRSAGQSHRPARSGEIPVFSLCSCSRRCLCLFFCLSSRRDLLLSLFVLRRHSDPERSHHQAIDHKLLRQKTGGASRTLQCASEHQTALTRIARERGRALELHACFVGAAELGQKIAAHARQQVVVLERRLRG